MLKYSCNKFRSTRLRPAHIKARHSSTVGLRTIGRWGTGRYPKEIVNQISDIGNVNGLGHIGIHVGLAHSNRAGAGWNAKEVINEKSNIGYIDVIEYIIVGIASPAETTPGVGHLNRP